MRIRSPERITEPSTTAWTFNFLAISGTELCVPLNCIDDVREMTRRLWIVESRPMSASVMPSAR